MTKYIFMAALALSVAAFSQPAAAKTGVDAKLALDPSAAIAHSQAAIGRVVGAHSFLDTARDQVRLSDYRGKPLVVNMVFTACVESCPLVVQALYTGVEIAQDTLGDEAFSVVTIGFDAKGDTPERMRAFARGQGVDLANWKFLSGDQASIDSLVETLGFIYFPSPRGFDHLAQTTVIDAEGRVYRQVYGAQFNAPALVEPLLELVLGRAPKANLVAALVDRVRLFCTTFDAASGRYRFDYSIFIAFAVGGLSLLGLGAILVRAWWRSRPDRHHA